MIKDYIINAAVIYPIGILLGYTYIKDGLKVMKTSTLIACTKMALGVSILLLTASFLHATYDQCMLEFANGTFAHERMKREHNGAGRGLNNACLT